MAKHDEQSRVATKAIEALQQLESPLWVITSATGEGRGGLTASWVYSASLDPESPLLLASLGVRAHTTQLVEHAGWFAAHLLRPDQVETAWNFCRDSGRDRDKLEGVPLLDEETPPMLADCAASYRCRVVSRLVTGDRVMYWGAVEQARLPPPAGKGAPRLLTDRLFFEQISPTQRATLGQALEADITAGRPLRNHWLKEMPRELRPESGGRH